MNATESFVACLSFITEGGAGWLERYLTPIVFTLLGAALGFATGRAKDALDARAARKDFLHAIRHELDGLRQSLEATANEIEAARDRLERGKGLPPQFAGTLRTTVFSTRLGKLRDIADPITLEVIRFYSDLPQLDQIRDLTNSMSQEYARATSEQRNMLVDGVRSGLRVLHDQVQGFLKRLDTLYGQFPKS